MKIVINYMQPETSQTKASGQVVFGMDVAVAAFLRAYFRYSRQEHFFFLPGSDASIDALKSLAREEKMDFSRCAWLSPTAPRETLSDVEVLFRPDPNLPDAIWRRLQLAGRGYALSSVAHTLSGERVAQVLGDYLLAPTRAGDALICPSKAVKQAVEQLWEIQAAYYQHRFQSPALSCPVSLPVIPLGIDNEKFASLASPEQRAMLRAALGIDEAEVVILYVGRFSYATKAHPLPLFQAAEMAAIASKKKVRLLLYGFFMPQLMEAEFHSLAAAICQQVQVDFILNTDPRFPHGVWAAGDIFASLVDNIQESFGLTPLEAMACGLPVVVSDWDGYRDSVRHGVEGFLVPTLSVPPGSNVAIAEHYYNHRNYGQYLLYHNQSVAVDATYAATALQVLIEDKEKRLAMGQRGKQRAAGYDWRHSIAAYEALWAEQAARRPASLNGLTPPHWAAAHPAYPDPAAMFASFPTRTLTPADTLFSTGDAAAISLLAHHTMNIIGLPLLLPEAELAAMLAHIHAHPGQPIHTLQTALALADTALLFRSISWFLKMGLLRVG